MLSRYDNLIESSVDKIFSTTYFEQLDEFNKFSTIKKELSNYAIPTSVFFNFLTKNELLFVKLIPEGSSLENFVSYFPELESDLFQFYKANEHLCLKSVLGSRMSFLYFIKVFATRQFENNLFNLFNFDLIKNNFFRYVCGEHEISTLLSFFSISQKILQDFLIQLIQESTNDKVAACKDLLTTFLNKNDPLYYKRGERITIFLNLIRILLNPEKIEQGTMNVCGAVAFLTLFFEYNPRHCVESFIELIETGKSYKMLPLKANGLSESRDYEVSTIYLTAIKNATNKLGYFPSVRFFSDSANSLELFGGLTEPATICKWLTMCDFQDIFEAMLVKKSNDSSPEWYHYLLSTDGIFSEKHKQFFSLADNLREAVSHAQSGKSLIFSLSVNLCAQELKEDSKIENFLGIDIHHYVVVNQIDYDECQDIVRLQIFTWGKSRDIEIDAQQFLKNYHGFISATPPNSIILENESRLSLY